jgi:hypothetical protein
MNFGQDPVHSKVIYLATWLYQNSSLGRLIEVALDRYKFSFFTLSLCVTFLLATSVSLDSSNLSSEEEEVGKTEEAFPQGTVV